MPKDSTWTACIVAVKTHFEACFELSGSAIPPRSFESGQPICITSSLTFPSYRSPLLMHFFILLKRLLIDWHGESNLNIYQGNINRMLGLWNWCSLGKKSCKFLILKSLCHKAPRQCVDRWLDNKMNEFKIETGLIGGIVSDVTDKGTLWQILFSRNSRSTFLIDRLIPQPRNLNFRSPLPANHLQKYLTAFTIANRRGAKLLTWMFVL